MPHLNVDGVSLYYERHGDAGEPLVFVHGYTGDTTDWRHQVAAFRRSHQILILDQRGHGRSGAPAARVAYSVERVADDVEALVAHAGFERYHLVGHSMGGAVAQESALRSPGRLISLTLHDSSATFRLPRSEVAQKYVEMRYRLAEEQGMAAVAALPGITKESPHLPPERKIEMRERLERMAVHGFVGAFYGLQAWNGTKDRVHLIETPTLVIVGSLDASVMVDASRWLAETIPGAAFEMIPEAAHSPQWDRPDLYNDALRRHLERNAAYGAK